MLFGLRPGKILRARIRMALGDPPAYTNPKLEELARKFREGIAEALGVPPEYIDEEKVRKWVENWAKAWIKPEYWQEVFHSPSGWEVKQLGYELGKIVREVEVR